MKRHSAALLAAILVLAPFGLAAHAQNTTYQEPQAPGTQPASTQPAGTQPGGMAPGSMGGMGSGGMGSGGMGGMGGMGSGGMGGMGGQGMHGMGAGGMHHGKGGLVQMLHGIKLTADQRQQARGLMQNFRPDFMRLMRGMRATHSQYQQALLAGAPEATLLPLVHKELAQHDQAELARARLELKIRALLTPDQLAALRQKQAEAN